MKPNGSPMAAGSPRAVAVIHIPVYLSAKGKCHADAATRDAAMRGQPPGPATPITAATTMALSFPIPEFPDLLSRPKYTPQDLQWIKNRRFQVLTRTNGSGTQEGS